MDPWVRKIPWKRNGNPLQSSYLENPMDRGAYQVTAHRIVESDTTEMAEHKHKRFEWGKNG